MIYQTKLLRALILSLLIVMASPIARGQNASTASSQDDEVLIKTNLVQTDVTVTDKQNRFVEGLKQEDFVIKVDGREQPITSFEIVRGARLPSLTASKDATRPAQESIVAPSASAPRSVVFFVDDLHLSPEGSLRAKEVLNNFIKTRLTPDLQVLIASSSGQIGFLQQFTTDANVMREAVRRISYQSRQMIDNEKPPMSVYEAQLIERGDRDTLAYQVQTHASYFGYPPNTAQITVTQRARNILRQSSYINDAGLKSLEQIATTRTPTGDRRTVFFISEGFILDNRVGDSFRKLERVLDAAARTGTVIYTLDARGLATGAIDASSQRTADLALANPLGAGNPFAGYNPTAELRANQEVLRTLAEDTGGRALLNNNDLENLVARTLDETSTYYLIGWRPDAVDETKREPVFKKIEVSLRNRKDVKVRARRGFYNRRVEENLAVTNRAVPTTTNAILNAALNEIVPRRDIPVAMQTIFASPENNKANLTATVELISDVRGAASEISGASLSTAPANSSLATIDVACILLDAKGKVVYSDGRTATFTPRANSSTANNNAGDSSANASSDVKGNRISTMFATTVSEPGLYQFRVAAHDARSKRTGTAFQWIEVPKLEAGKIALSSIVAVELPAASTAANASTGARPNVALRFNRNSRLLLQLVIYNAATDAASARDVTMQLQVKSGERIVNQAAAHAVSVADVKDFTRIPYSAAIPLRTLAPGVYTVQATVTNTRTRATVTQNLSITVD